MNKGLFVDTRGKDGKLMFTKQIRDLIELKYKLTKFNATFGRRPTEDEEEELPTDFSPQNLADAIKKVAGKGMARVTLLRYFKGAVNASPEKPYGELSKNGLRALSVYLGCGQNGDVLEEMPYDEIERNVRESVFGPEGVNMRCAGSVLVEYSEDEEEEDDNGPFDFLPSDNVREGMFVIVECDGKDVPFVFKKLKAGNKYMLQSCPQCSISDGYTMFIEYFRVTERIHADNLKRNIYMAGETVAQEHKSYTSSGNIIKITTSPFEFAVEK